MYADMQEIFRIVAGASIVCYYENGDYASFLSALSEVNNSYSFVKDEYTIFCNGLFIVKYYT